MNKDLQGAIEYRLVPLNWIIPNPSNYNTHPPEQIASLKASLARFGQVRPYVVKQIGEQQFMLAAGEGTTIAARELVQVHPQQFAHLAQAKIMIVPQHWTDVDLRAYMVADNETAKKAEPDEQLLAILLQEQQDAGYDLASLGGDDETLRQMLEALGDEMLSGDSEEDDFEAEPDETQTRVQPGDIWRLGRHTIACLDALDRETYARLFSDTQPAMVFADPPYGISIVATNVSVGGGEAYDIPFGGVKNRTRGDVGGGASHMRKTGRPYIADRAKGSIGGANPPGSKNNLRSDPQIMAGKYAPVIGDDTTMTAIASSHLCLDFFPNALQIWWGANYYANALPPSKCWLVWDKENTGNFADAELAWCSDDSAVRIFKHMWNGLMKDSEKGQRRVHPTQKPIKLAEWCYEKYGKENDVIFDPFLGSGMSLIAAENTNRTMIGCELSPEYIDIILTRWEKHTGQTATLQTRVEEVSRA
jgi:DNA methylase